MRWSRGTHQPSAGRHDRGDATCDRHVRPTDRARGRVCLCGNAGLGYRRIGNEHPRCKWTDIRGRHEAISLTRDRLDEPWGIRGVPQRLAQPSYGCIEDRNIDGDRTGAIPDASRQCSCASGAAVLTGARSDGFSTPEELPTPDISLKGSRCASRRPLSDLARKRPPFGDRRLSILIDCRPKAVAVESRNLFDRGDEP